MIGSLLLAVLAQGAPAQACPTATVSSAAGEKSIVFTANVGKAGGKITYNWLITVGTIKKGQGTPAIEVAVDKGQFVTASVEIGGLPKDCPSFISASDEIY